MARNICVDFDGVIHSYMTPWEAADIIPDAPVKGAIEWLEYMILHEDYIVSIYSSRSRQGGGINAMEDWLVKHFSHPDLVNHINFPNAKPPAHMYIDDRAFCFRGTFPSIQEIDSFKPWFDKYKAVSYTHLTLPTILLV